MSSSGEILDIPEWTGEKFWEPDPDDIALFQERPEDAAEVYRNLFISNDRKLLGFMHAFPVVDRTPRQEELLWSSGFPLALLESLTDSRWYESFNDMATHSGFVQYVYATIESIQFALAIQNLLALMIAISPDPLTHNKAFEQCFQHFPDMWKLVWRYRDIVLSDSFDVANGGVRSYIGGLLQRYCRIYRGISSQAPPLESYVAHIALYLLVIPQNPDATTHCDPAYLLMSVLKQEGRAALEREHSFLNEVVPTVTGGANLKGFTRIIRRDLVRRRPTTAEQFQNTLSATGLLLMWVPPMATPERNGGRRLVLLALAAAAQRYECHGCDDEQWTDLHRRPVFLAEPFLDVYIGLIASAGEGAHALMTNDIVNNPYHFSFTHVLARSMATACEKNWGNLQKVFQHFMNAYLTVASLGRTRYHTDRARWRKYCYLRRILQVHWLPSLARMRAALHVSNSQSGPDPAGQDSLQGIVKRWADVGRAFNLSDGSREKDSGLRSYVTEEELRLGCFYPECLCYGEKPLHGIRRVCTGCWSVYYCGERCQKKDWLLGHRNVCGGRSASADVARRHTGVI